ncbi:cell division protein FtsQ/DivIB [Williamsia sp. MIQD14]|uniref:cell division protein FtsQ/DivIB n=1 Tax=Williamsia sp. MIQD14 TaxID=3425703 RepID=UPI003DA19E79
MSRTTSTYAPDAHVDDHDEYDDGYADDKFDDGDVDDRGRPPRTRRGRRPVRGTRKLLGTIAAIVLVIAGGVVAYTTPLMSVRSISVSGESAVDPASIVAASRIALGTPLLQVDTRPAAQRIAAIPRVKSVRVTRSYPSGIDIDVVERVAVAFVIRDGASHLIDVTGVDFASQKQLPPVPRMTIADPSPSDRATLAALKVVSELPDVLRRQVIEIGAQSAADVRMTLRDRRTVVWGDADRTADKARTLMYLLPRDGTSFNVSSPEYPTFR